MARRTPTINVDEDFETTGRVTKAWEDKQTGERYIRGVASGVLEDRDGERVSARAIAKMSAQPTTGGAIKLTSSHAQDWVSEFGDVVKLNHTQEHDELDVVTKLPRPGMDPIADKAWRALTVEGQELGFSIGGKLKKAYFELVDGDTAKGGRPRRRKVLDDIHLRHVMLTARPSYTPSFAEAVAKTFTPDTEPDASDDGVWTFEPDGQEAADALAIAKASAKPNDDEPAAKPAAPAADPPDTAPAPAPGAPPAATGDTSEDPDKPESDAEAAQGLPEAKRHLACPSCGHEFAADLPATDAGDPITPNSHNKDDADARKSQEDTMETTQDTLAKIRALVDAEPVAKTETEPPADAKVEKQAPAEDDASDVQKMLAASHRHAEDRADTLESAVKDGFDAVAKAFTSLAARIDARPQGRQSVARILPTPAEVEKTEAGTEDTVEDLVAKTDDPLEALKVINHHRGVR